MTHQRRCHPDDTAEERQRLAYDGTNQAMKLASTAAPADGFYHVSDPR